MKIGFDAKRAFCNFTGLGNYSRSTISILAERHPDHRFLLYTTPFAPHPELAFARRANVEVIEPKGMARKVPALWRTLSIAALAERDGVSLFHGLSGELPEGLSKRGVRSVVTIHDLIFMRFPEFYGAVDRWIYERKFRGACARADRVIAISEATKRDVVTLLGVDERKVRVVYQGCHPNFRRSCSEEEKRAVADRYALPERFVLYVGTIEHRKNLLSLVRAMPMLPSDCSLVALGRPTSYFAEVEREIARLGVGDRVKVIPRSSFADLPAIYQRARVFALPSLFEGFGIPLLEALESGTPVVAARSSSLPEAGGPQGRYVDPMDAVGYAEAIGALLDDSETRRDVIARGFEHAAKFRDGPVAEAMWGVYREVSGKG